MIVCGGVVEAVVDTHSDVASNPRYLYPWKELGNTSLMVVRLPRQPSSTTGIFGHQTGTKPFKVQREEREDTHHITRPHQKKKSHKIYHLLVRYPSLYEQYDTCDHRQDRYLQ